MSDCVLDASAMVLAVSGKSPGATKCIAQCNGSSPIYAYNTEAEGVAATVAFLKYPN